MERLASGRINLAVGLLGIAAFMVFGFILIFLRDFAPGHEQWAADYGIGKHFEARLAHVHGALFSVLNLVIGVVLPQLGGARTRSGIAALTLAGLLMPAGILAEVLFGAPPVFVLLGGVSILVAFVWAGVEALRTP
ncbi:MAG: hypothetical protein H6734_02370 [Alphaproteobacteria bacterium]|nr:hypothetical protein [Alphaproteobacteria bacterium]